MDKRGKVVPSCLRCRPKTISCLPEPKNSYLRAMKPITTYPLLTSRFDLGRYCRIDVKQAYRKEILHALLLACVLFQFSCRQVDKQGNRQVSVDTLATAQTTCESVNETNVGEPNFDIPYLLPIDSLWKYYNPSMTTSGRCNRPEIFDDERSKDLFYGFYCIFDTCAGRTYEVAHIIVSYRKSPSWWSSDTTQKIREIIVMDRRFALPIASFHVGEPIRYIKDKPVLKKGNYYCYSGEGCCYVVESHHDTIQQFFVFPYELMSDWNRLLKYVKSH